MDEIVKIIRIESEGSEQTVAGLVAEIKNLTEAMNGVEKGTEQYTSILKELIENQDKLTKAMRTNKQEVTAAEGSYNALVKQMAALKKQWRETTDEASRKELGKQIKSINEDLKKMDASIGDFRRNVGNYAGSIKDAFGMMGGAAKGMVGPLNSVKQGFNALSAHPLIGVLTALAALLINGVAKGFKNSEEASNKMKVAFSALQGISDLVSKAFEKVALWIANVTEKTIKLLDWLGFLSPELKKSMEDRKKIAEDEIKLDDKRRDNIKKNANLEKEAAELRAKAADKDKYTAQERLAFLEQAEQKELEISNNEVESLKLEWDIAKAKLEINKDNAELKDAEAEAEAKYVAAQTAHAQKLEASRKAISRTRKEMVRDAQQAAAALLKLEKELMQQEYDLAVDGSEEQLRLAKQMAAKDREIAINEARAKIKDKDKLNKALLLIDQKYYKDLAKIEFTAANNRIAKQEEQLDLEADSIFDAVGRAKKKLDNAEKILKEKQDLLASMTDKTTEDYANLEMEITRRQIAIKELSDGYYQALSTEAEIHRTLIMETTIPLSNAYAKVHDKLVEEYRKIKQLNDESDDQFNIRKKNLQKQLAETMRLWNDTKAKEFEVYEAYRELNDIYLKYDKFNENISNKQPWFGFQLRKSTEEELEKTQTIIGDRLERLNNYIRLTIGDDADKYAKFLTERFNILNENLPDDAAQIEYWKNFFGVNAFDEISGEMLKKLMLDDQKFEEIKNKLGEYGLLPLDLMDEYNSALADAFDNESALLDARYSKWSRFAQSIGQLFNGIGAIYEADLEGQKHRLEQSGKYNDQERKMLEDQYNKTVKPIKIAEATISTLQGALDAFMSAQDLKWPMGPIVGGIMMASTLALGAAQIMKISQTNPYEANSSSLSSSGSMMSATVTPTVSDYNPEYTSNLTGRSDTEYLNEVLGNQKLFVSVVDINDAQERGRVRVAESSF